MKQLISTCLGVGLGLMITSCGDNSSINATETATCTDGIQNGDEVDVDCGGSCEACATQDPTCGDGELDVATEECDDHDVLDGDGCDALCRLEFHEDFEDDNAAWILQNAAIEATGGNSNTALHIYTSDGVCNSGAGELVIEVPPSAAAIHFDLKGDVPAGGEFQMWMTLGYALAEPALPITSTATQQNWCVPIAARGTSQTMRFVVRTQNTCTPIDAWIDNISIIADDTGCTPLVENT